MTLLESFPADELVADLRDVQAKSCSDSHPIISETITMSPAIQEKRGPGQLSGRNVASQPFTSVDADRATGKKKGVVPKHQVKLKWLHVFRQLAARIPGRFLTFSLDSCTAGLI